MRRGLAGWTASPSSRTPRTARCGGWRPASPRSGTPCWPCRARRRGPAPDHPALQRPPTGCSTRRSRPGRLAGAPAGPGRRAAGRSSSTTTTTPTSTTPPRWCSRCAGSAHRDPDASRAAPSTAAVRWMVGHAVQRTAAGARSTPTTPATLADKLPFCDFGAVIDPPSADVTAHMVEALAAEGLAGEPAARRGVVWLLRAQEPDGSWFGRWGANYVYGTGAVVPALIAAGVPPRKPAIRRAVAWLEQHQNADGGWGEDLRSYDDPALGGRGESTASQTAWALLALLAAGERDATAAERGVALAGRDPARGRHLGRAASSPAPASPATSTSTTTCTGWCSRSARSAATSTEAAHMTEAIICAPHAHRGPRDPARACGPTSASTAPIRPRCSAPATAPSRAADRAASAESRRVRPDGRAGRRRRADRRPRPGRPGRRHRGPGPGRPACLAPLLAGELRRAGLTVQDGPDRRPWTTWSAGRERARAGRRRRAGRRHGVGARWPARPADRPVAVIRAVSDTPAADRCGPGIVCRRAGRAARAARRRAGAERLGGGLRAAPGAAGRAAVVLRRRRAGHRDRRAGARAARARRSTCASRSCTTPTWSPTWSAAARCSWTSSTRCPTGRPWCSPRTACLPRCGPRPAGAAWP